MSLLILDNHDSFTFNLVELVRQLGVPFSVVYSEAVTDEQIERASHLLISPGPDVPSAYPRLFEVLEKWHQTKPILGVCLGHQTLCEFFGGRLYNLGRVRHGLKLQLQQRAPNALFHALPAQFAIGLYHSWAVDADSLANTSLMPTAFCEQGVLMAMQHQTLPIFGVQFHPESFISEHGAALLAAFLAQTAS